MGIIIPFDRNTTASGGKALDSVLIELSQKNIVLDVDPDIIEALGLVEETALSDKDAVEGDIEFADYESAEEA